MKGEVEYTPPPTVSAFISSEKFYNFIVGPVGSGKTTGMLFKILYHAARQAPNPNDGIRRTRWVIIRNTMPQLKDTTLKSFFSWFTPGVAGHWAVTDKVFTFRFDDVEAEVLFRPLDTPDDVGRVLSLEVTGACLDEFVEIPKDIIEALSGRCGRYPPEKDGGPTWHGMWGASNPGNEDNWWYDWMYGDWADTHRADGTTETGAEAKERLFNYFEQPSGLSAEAENLDNLPGKRGYYTNLCVGKSDAWIRQFVKVEWGYSLSGTPVWPAFHRNLHVSDTPLKPIPGLPILIGFDAGLTPAAILGQQDSHGRVLILRELVATNMGARRFCREKLAPLLHSFGNHSFEFSLIGDPAITQRAQTDEATVASILAEELGLPVVPAQTNALAARLDAVEKYLTLLTDVGPALLLDPGCKTLIRGMAGGYRYEINRKGDRAPTPKKDAYSHPADALQYLCLGFQQAVGSTKLMATLKLHRQPQHNIYAW